MKLRNLFYLLAALPLVFAACESGSEDIDKTPELKPVLTLTSEAIVDVVTAGGEFEITYTLENAKEGVELTATCEAEWVDVATGDKVKVVVAANEGEAREAKIVVAYSEQSFEVTVKQAAKEQGEEPEKPAEPVLTLTSEATMEFAAEGGEGEIAYTLENEAEGVELEATCEAQWVSDVVAGERVTFVVAANEGEARETKVVVTYGEQSFEVAVKQAAKEQGEDPKPEFKMDVDMAVAVRIPSNELGLADNYFALAFADDAENIELGVVLAAAEGVTVLPAGTYASNNGGVLTEACEMFIWDPATEASFTEAEVVVTLEGEIYTFDIVLVDEKSAYYHFSYEGVVLDMIPEDEPELKPEQFVPTFVEAYRKDTWDAGNFELDLYIDDTNYHALDMQDNVNPNDKYLTAGKYSYADGSITSWSNIIYKIETGEGAYLSAAEIELTHNADGTSTIKGYFESEYGQHFDIDWTGVVAGFDFGTNEDDDEEDVDDGATVWDITEVAWGYMSENTNDIVLKSPSTAGGLNSFTFELVAAVTNNKLPDGVYSSTDGGIAINYCKQMVDEEMSKMTDAEVTITNNSDGTTTIAARWTANEVLNRAKWVGELPEYEL